MDLHDLEAVGRTATLHTRERFTVHVKVKGAREVYGRLEYLVGPTCGAGHAWVSARRVKMERRSTHSPSAVLAEPSDGRSA